MDLVPMSKGKRQKAGEKELQVSAKDNSQDKTQDARDVEHLARGMT